MVEIEENEGESYEGEGGCRSAIYPQKKEQKMIYLVAQLSKITNWSPERKKSA